MLAIWFLISLTFLSPACTSGGSQFMYCWSLAWKNVEYYLTSIWNKHSCKVVWAFFGIAFLWDRDENLPLTVLRPLKSFPHLPAYWVQYFYNVAFRIWNRSAGIPSPPLVLFVVMLPQDHLTTHSRMSGSSWMTTPSWLFRSLKLFNIIFLCILVTSS